MTDTSGESPTTAGATVLTGKEAPPPQPASAEDRALIAEAAEHRRPLPEGGEHGAHPDEKQYMIIAAVLAVLTAVEVGVSYIKGLGDASAPLLLILAVCKFVLVAGYFMHLKFDSRVLRRFFVTGIVLALTVYTVVFFTLGIFTTAHGVHS